MSELFTILIMDAHWYNFASFLFLPLLQWVMGSFYVWEISVGLNWNRKYGFPEYFTFNGACLKVSRLARGLMHFKWLWPSLDLSQLAMSGLLVLHIRGTSEAECGNSQMAVLLCLVREKVRWRDEVNEMWFEKKILCVTLPRFRLHPKEAWETNHTHFSPCPLIHKWLRLSLFPSASGHGLSVMTLSIKPKRQSVSRVALSPAAAALVFITVSVRDRDKLRSLRAVKGSFHRQGFLSPVRSLWTPPFHNKGIASDYICPQSLIKISADRQ